MRKTLTFLHTSPIHIKTFNVLLEQHAQVPVKHLVHESLLEEASQAGYVTNSVKEACESILSEAEQEAKVILCTCSTLGKVAESLNDKLEPEIIRIDRPLAEKALELGDNIVVLAAVKSTLKPTQELLEDVAAEHSTCKTISLDLVEGAWSAFEDGDLTSYHQIIATHIDTYCHDADVIVLAQASMAAAVEFTQTSKPVLSSPSIGLEAALQAFYSKS